VKERLPVVGAHECKGTNFTDRKSSRMKKNNYLSYELSDVKERLSLIKERLPVGRAPECKRTITCRKSS
jgi:hypothetical protein